MSQNLTGGCAHIKSEAKHGPIDNHTCHCSVCKSVTGQATTHVAFFNHADVAVSNEAGLKRQPFNAKNPDGPLELCTCGECGAPLMLDDKQSRIRVIVPNVMGYAPASFPAASYHAFYDSATGVPKPNDGRPVHEALRPDFVWPKGA
ncbi:MAG: GFA family protein [Albidovulum sp.]